MPSDFKPDSEITFQFEGLNRVELERVRKAIEQMFASGVFSIRYGKVILHFDGKGDLVMIGKDFMAWKRLDHPPTRTL